MATAAAASVVVVFDFDKTIIEWDSDDWVITKLGAADAFNRLRPTMRWNSLMDRMMGELHAQGRLADDIRECLRSAPLDAHVLSAIRTASALGYMCTAATMDGCMPYADMCSWFLARSSGS
ncbi:hypothetical protein ACQ4PT_002034 [Festuca glaucescens]